MIRITKEADYAIMLLTHMAERALGEVHAAREISSWSGIPLPMVSKILRSLARGQLVRSHRGVSGGYSLRRSADEISVAEVIRAVEGPISMVQCGVEPGACEHEPLCPTRLNWARISRQVETALEQVPISEMLPGADESDNLPLCNDESRPAPSAG